MKNFVAYHNSEKMGYPLSQGDPFCVLSNSSLSRLHDNRVWLVEGTRVEKAPRKRFALASVFHVTEVGDLTDGSFKHYAAGKGHIFASPVTISDEKWFDSFRLNARSFDGITQIKDDTHLAALAEIATNDGYVIDSI